MDHIEHVVDWEGTAGGAYHYLNARKDTYAHLPSLVVCQMRRRHFHVHKTRFVDTRETKTHRVPYCMCVCVQVTLVWATASPHFTSHLPGVCFSWARLSQNRFAHVKHKMNVSWNFLLVSATPPPPHSGRQTLTDTLNFTSHYYFQFNTPNFILWEMNGFTSSG